MPQSLSFDLRSRVLAAVDEGLSCRQAAARFGVSASSAIRWAALRRAGGDGRPKQQGGDRLSHRTEAHAGPIRAMLDEVPDIALPELKARLAGNGTQVSVAALWRFCRRHKLTRKKRRRTPEVDRRKPCRLSHRTEAHASLIHAALDEVPDITLPELKARLAGQGAQVSVTALWRFCRRHKLTRKKRPRTRPSRIVRTS